MNATAAKAIDWSEQGLVPDSVIRHGIRRLLKTRLDELGSHDCERSCELKTAFIRDMQEAPIALLAHKANEQHYEVPSDFFSRVLGKFGKYSCAYWSDDVATLDDAEHEALEITCEHAGIEDGMEVLELGCGWGSLTLWMATRYPDTAITAVSNSHSQREHITRCARSRGLSNVNVITSDMNEFTTTARFDRVVSVEMFEHMRNYRELFERISRWLKPGGLFFMHIFCNRAVPYAFEDRNDTDWMSRYYFSGGMMPSDDLPLHFQEHLSLTRQWRWNGQHYEKTANAWLRNMDRNKAALWPILEQTYGKQSTQQWWMRWRMFFMACAELFGYDNGQQWWVSHYLFQNRGRL